MSRAVVLRGIDLEVAPNWASLATRRLALFAGWEPRHRAGWWADVDRDMAGTTWELQLGRAKLVLTRKAVGADSPAGYFAIDQV